MIEWKGLVRAGGMAGEASFSATHTDGDGGTAGARVEGLSGTDSLLSVIIYVGDHLQCY